MTRQQINVRCVFVMNVIDRKVCNPGGTACDLEERNKGTVEYSKFYQVSISEDCRANYSICCKKIRILRKYTYLTFHIAQHVCASSVSRSAKFGNYWDIHMLVMMKRMMKALTMGMMDAVRAKITWGNNRKHIKKQTYLSSNNKYQEILASNIW